MSQRSKRNQEKRKKLDEERIGKYYDANTLTSGECHREIHNMHGTGSVAITSSLAVGEVIMNILNKTRSSEDAKIKAESFVDFLAKQMDRGCIRVESSEGAKTELFKLLDMTGLDVADAYHVALAIKHKCNCIASCDPDIHGLSRAKLAEIKEVFKLSEFSVDKKLIDDE